MRGTNRVALGLATDPRSGLIKIFSALDNLTKGAGGQAVQNANLMLGLPETAGLDQPALTPRPGHARRGPDDLWSLVGGAFPPHQVPFVHPEPDSRDQRRLALVLAYDGTAYGGWQVQPEGPTIQAAVEAALSRLCDHPVRLAASGRTDAGVHAVGQVAAFSTTSRLELDRMARGLAALLPPDIHPRALGAVADDFHPATTP